MTGAVLGGRYELLEKISVTGNADVFRALDGQTGGWCAVKLLMPEATRRTGAVERFERQGAVLVGLPDHPNLVRALAFGVEPDGAYLVMEYAEGGPVTRWLEQHGPMPPRLATTVAIQVCRGVAHAHGEGVIHGGIGLNDVLVAGDGACKVTDFGVAQLFTRTRTTSSGFPMGSPGYVAPERRESAERPDQRVDVYAIAAVLYTLVHGEAATHLFMAEDRDFDGVPAPLAAVIRKGAQYRREARYQTVEGLCAALEAVLDQLPEDPPGAPPLLDPHALRAPPGTPLPVIGPRQGLPRPPERRALRASPVLALAIVGLLAVGTVWCAAPW